MGEVPRALPFLLLIVACAACAPATSDRAARRATLHRAGHVGGHPQSPGPASIEILPAEGQPPYCLAFTASEQGVVRQLTMTPANESVPCRPGEPVGGTAYRVPPAEGKVRVYVVFSDRKLDATPIGAQIHELGKGAGLTAMDLRAPGQVLLETLELDPSL